MLALARAAAFVTADVPIERRSQMRGLVALGAVMAVVAVAATPAVASARVPQPVYFWGSTANFVSVPKGQAPAGNPRVIKPRTILMFADGSWALVKLHWRGWGTRVARATGVSSASNGIPDQASGKRITSRAYVRLTNPGRFKGHEVYRCFHLRIPKHPRSNEHLCLAEENGYWLLESPPTSAEFFAGPPLRGVGCEIDGVARPGIPAQVLCESRSADLVQKATLSAGGRVRICSKANAPAANPCNQGDFGEGTPTYGVGKRISLGAFRCTVRATGVRCVVRRTGKGFSMSLTGTTRVG